MLETHFQITLPSWVLSYAATYTPQTDVQERMRFVLDVAAANIKNDDGGPFAAAVFDQDHHLVSVGVNQVVKGGSSILHAEMIALALAQKSVGRYDLSSGGHWHYELVSSTEPCAMCMGAIPWAGIGQLVCGARDKDARAVGFDEGAKVKEWPREFAARGITVLQDVLRKKAADVLRGYAENGGVVYNAGK